MEVLKDIGKIVPNILLIIYNHYLRKQTFLEECKRARLVLIQTPGRMESVKFSRAL